MAKRKQQPAYYKLGSKYVALNGAARKLFKKKKIPYIERKQFINLKDIAKDLPKE
tara:strand:- start:76 stop:240 length:165 start_codon:yes stop_codon:yes gene_type:complete